MDIAAIRQRLDTERRSLERADERLTLLPHVTRMCSTANERHGVIYSAITAENADDVIDAEIDHHRALNVPFEWKVYSHDGPPDLLERLCRRGFVIGDKEAVMACDLDHADWIHAEGPGVVRRVAGPDELADFRAVAEAVFDKDYALTTDELAAAIAAGSSQHLGYVAYNPAGTPVAIGRLYTHPDSWFGGLFGGGTLPAFRGQGYYRATVAARALDAIRLGARYLTIDALPTSRPIVESLDFEHIADTWPAVWEPT